jgi:hypothetical protein
MLADRIGKIVRVTYFDHAILLNCISLESAEPVKRQCIGYLLYEDDEKMVLSFDFPQNSSSGMRVMVLRRADVISVEIISSEGKTLGGKQS